MPQHQPITNWFHYYHFSVSFLSAYLWDNCASPIIEWDLDSHSIGIPRGEIYRNRLDKVHWRLVQTFGGWQQHIVMCSLFWLSPSIWFCPSPSFGHKIKILRTLWIKNYLAERTQVIAVDRSESNPLSVLLGILRALFLGHYSIYFTSVIFPMLFKIDYYPWISLLMVFYLIYQTIAHAANFLLLQQVIGCIEQWSTDK